MHTSNGVKEIKSINKKSLAKMMALIYGLVGFFMALAVAGLTIINIIARKDFQGSAILVTLFNVGAGLLLGVLTALLTAILGWIIGYITAGIYNWLAGKNGGIIIELVEAVEKKRETAEEKVDDTNKN